MKTILSAAIVLVSSITMATANVAKSHEEVGQQSAALMTEMMTNMAKIKDKASAEAFVATVPDIKAKLKALLAAAQALPAPTEAEKTAVNKSVEAAEAKLEPLMMEMMKNIGTSPDAEAIGMIMGPVMQDPEMDEVGDALEKLYAQEDKEEVAPKFE